MAEPPPFEPVDEGPEYVYVQLADHIAALITSGHLRPGAKLPSERDQAEEYGVAYLTVRRAMQELRERGLIVTVVGRGTYVSRRPDSAPPASRAGETGGQDGDG
ncbi:GntR family transcriptional regulator [Actinomadura sp. SCN-SB]|jgi:GntR family transcriptional regulator|uniref:GntR family transcriptional regulator n=1 Tax=Actinomadura sp. SCN-SB TaxID=3373092 RepID=UPI00375052BE